MRRILNADRAYIVEFSGDFDRFEQTYESLNEGVVSRISDYKSHDSFLMMKLVGHSKQQSFVSLSNIDEDGENNELVRKLLGVSLTKAIVLISLIDHQQELIGVLGVSFNSIHQWSGEELKIIELASRMITSHLRIKIDKQDLQDYRDFQTLVLEISSQFINLPVEQVNHTIILSLEKLATFMNMQKACMFLVHKDDPTTWSMTHEWTEDVPIRWHQFQTVKIPEHEIIVQELRQLQSVEIGDIEISPSHYCVMRDILKISGVRSLIEIPISHQNRFVGFVGLTGTQPRRRWSKTDVALIKFAGEMFYQSLLHHATLEELEANNRKLSERRNFDELINFISTRLINAEGDNIDNFLHECNEVLKPVLNAHSIMICELINNGQDACYVSVVSSPDEKTLPEWVINKQPKAVSTMTMKWIWGEILQGKRMIFESLDDMPPEASEDRLRFTNHGVQSIAYFPLTVGSEILGFYFIAFTEPKHWDDELIEKFSIISQMIANAIHRRRTETKLKYLNQIEQLLNKLSTGFINLPLEKIDAGIDLSLAEIGQILQVDRAFLYEFSDDGIWLKLTHYWLAGGIPDVETPIPLIDLRQMDWAHTQLKEGNYLNFSDINKIPDQAQELREIYQKLGVKSKLFFPIFCHRKLRAIWGISTLRNYRDFNDQDLTVLSIFATTLANALERFEDESYREKLLGELESKNRELESFTYTVSHDLKSPIITINGFIGALKEDLKTQDHFAINDDLHEIEIAAIRMKQLLDELLKLSRIGRVINKSVNVDLNLVVKDVQSSLKHLLVDKNIQLTIQPDLPIVYGDPMRLREVFHNLVHNACKFTDKNQPQIEIGVVISNDGRKLVYVKDNGLGIEEKYFTRIFGLFERLDAKGEGTGIGLAIVKKIVECHLGEIWVESAGLGLGATFYLYLPLPPIIEN
jgi:signal transduction histidine kinase